MERSRKTFHLQLDRQRTTKHDFQQQSTKKEEYTLSRRNLRASMRKTDPLGE